jgi:hypothetical protein
MPSCAVVRYWYQKGDLGKKCRVRIFSGSLIGDFSSCDRNKEFRDITKGLQRREKPKSNEGQTDQRGSVSRPGTT